MGPGTKTGRGQAGFTLIELLLVLLLVALLVSLVAPVVTGSVQRAKESTLKENLYVMRKAIDDYYADRGAYPPDLDELVKKQYLRKIPKDPITDNKDSWVLVRSESDGKDGQEGIIDIRSGSDDKGIDGTAFKDW